MERIPSERPANFSEKEWLELLEAMCESATSAPQPQEQPQQPPQTGFIFDRKPVEDQEISWEREQEQEEENTDSAVEDYYIGDDFIAGQKGPKSGKSTRSGKAGTKRKPATWSEQASREQLLKMQSELSQFAVSLKTFSKEEDAISELLRCRGESERNTQITPDSARQLLAAALGWLFSQQSVVRKISLVVVPGSSAIYAIAETGLIHFGERVIAQITAGDTSGYRVERAALERHVSDKEGFLLWFAIHEFVHLLPNMTKHTPEFVSRVSSLADQCSFFFH